MMSGSDETGAAGLRREQQQAFLAPLSPSPAIAADPAGALSGSYALSGWWARVGAVVVDSLVVVLPLAILGLVVGAYHTTHYITDSGSVGTSVTVNERWAEPLAYFLYLFVLLTRRGGRNGQTLGKQATGIRILRNDGQPVDWRTVLLREGIGKAAIPALLVFVAPLLVLALLAYWLIDYLLPLVEPQNRALHDLIARTHVVRFDGGTKYFTPMSDPATSSLTAS